MKIQTVVEQLAQLPTNELVAVTSYRIYVKKENGAFVTYGKNVGETIDFSQIPTVSFKPVSEVIKEKEQIAERTERYLAEADQREAKMKASCKAGEEAHELYRTVETLAKEATGGWAACEILVGKNELAAFLVKAIGSFNANPYDNGQIILKADNGKRYGLYTGSKAVRNQAATIYDLLY